MNLTTSELAFVSIGATLVGVVIGGVITYKVTDRQVRSSETEGKLQREHDASQRQLERQHEIQLRDQERRAESYGVLILIASAYRSYATWVSTSEKSAEPERPAAMYDTAFAQKMALLVSPALIEKCLNMMNKDEEMMEARQHSEGDPEAAASVLALSHEVETSRGT